jgi:putative DNA primase/helicase
MVAGADTSRILTIESSLDENGQPCAFDPAQDIPLLREAVLNLGSVSLVIIDPMITAVSGDTNKANDVRRSLQPIVDLAEEFDCTVLGIHHLAKNSEGKSTNDRMLGSQAFAAMARMVLVAAKDEDSDKRVLAISKSNISKDNGGFNYTIEGVSFPSPKGIEIKTSRVVWGEALQGSSRSILADAEGEPNEDKSKLGEAKRFLIESLAHQAVGARELIRNAREAANISEKSLRRAKDVLGIRAEHAPAFEGGWSWALPLSNQLNAARNSM